jgi:DNA-binding MarR family transcriptional regulator
MSNRWTFLSSHGLVFEYIARHKQNSVEIMSREIGITQRAVFKIMKDLEKDGYITRKKVGRNNQYEIHSDLPMRHPLDNGRPVKVILSS